MGVTLGAVPYRHPGFCKKKKEELKRKGKGKKEQKKRLKKGKKEEKRGKREERKKKEERAAPLFPKRTTIQKNSRGLSTAAWSKTTEESSPSAQCSSVALHIVPKYVLYMIFKAQLCRFQNREFRV